MCDHMAKVSRYKQRYFGWLWKKFGTRSFKRLPLLNDRRLCKKCKIICNEYEIFNMQREGSVSVRLAGFESMFIDWKPPPPIPDWLFNVLPGWVWGFFTFYKLKSLRLFPRRPIRSGMPEARNWISVASNDAAVASLRPDSFESFPGGKKHRKKRR